MEAKWNVRAHRTSPRTPLFTGVPAHSVKREGIFLQTCFQNFKDHFYLSPSEIAKPHLDHGLRTIPDFLNLRSEKPNIFGLSLTYSYLCRLKRARVYKTRIQP